MNNSLELNEFIKDTVHRYSITVLKVAFSYLKNTADSEDIVQEVFFAFMKKQSGFESEEHLKAWLIRVTINKCKNYLKSGWFRSINPIPDNLTYMPKEDNELLSAVLSLDVKYRIPIHLYYYENYSINEIAAILKARPATIGTRLARGRKILKDMIGGLDDE